jgi:Flp pilus assembly protein TadB
MRGDRRRRASTSIGALTRRDRHREAALMQKIDVAYRNFSTTSSGRGRRRSLRSARRNERALIAQRRRPQSALTALAFLLVGLLAAIALLRASLTLAAVVGAVLVVDLSVLRRRRRTLRRA